MSEEEKKAIEGLKKDLLIHECWEANNLDKIFKISHLHSLGVVLNLVEKQQEQLQEKDKIIELMGEDIQSWRFDNSTTGKVATIEAIIEYFTKKAREV